METFEQVLLKYSSKDNLQGTDKATTHSYGPVYRTILQDLAGRDKMTILEIGILSGSFLQVLHELLPGAELHGIDIDLSRYRYPKDLPRIHLYERNGTLKETAAFVNQRFDLIIEDGDHSTTSQLKTLDAFAPYLKPNGYYVVEDIVSGNEKHKQALEEMGRSHGLSMEWLELTAEKNRYDDIIAIFRI